MESELKKLKKIISEHLKISEDQIKDEISYEEESNWDSVTHLKMVADIEEAFDINFDTDEIISLETIAKIKELVIKKIKKD